MLLLFLREKIANKAEQIDNLQAVQIVVPLRYTLRQFGQLINCG